MSNSGAVGLAQVYPWLTGAALLCVGVAAAILVWYLIKRPPLDATLTRISLLLGLGVFPIAAAGIGNVIGYEHSSERTFCGSCHVMLPWTNDSANPKSQTLAARHARNEHFGYRNCYTCHEDYGMFGTVVTKLGGMRHVWMYYTEYRKYTIAEAIPKIHIRKPYPNSNCMTCHSTRDKLWLDVGAHKSLLKKIRSGKASCASSGCHGPAHPFSKPEEEKKKEENKPEEASGTEVPDGGGSTPPPATPASEGGAP